MIAKIGKIIGNNTFQINNQLSKKLLQELMEVPSYFSKILIARCANNANAVKATKG